MIDPDNMTATTRGLQSWCYSVAMREDPIVAVARPTTVFFRLLNLTIASQLRHASTSSHTNIINPPLVA